ncbi:DUF1611 domain-containing protein [Spirulina sp. CS-785/01]|uniref:DUF1611 domain-containing protein n=1 Tax=Spirulina sp. CS-785/01 TaxID=3021716 RepID=UPI00232CBB9F|nr:DUF1611 domain-containing protein [Spirulina sp. CS-785/01]MDB9315445.1 DUF1611 domain-containing protein [Spirulina sp. CS-785/01]
MKLTPEHRVAILLHDGLQDVSGKTGLAFLRYGEASVVAIIDRNAVGGSLVDLTGIDRDIPIVATLEDALTYHPDVLLIGIAPSGGALPDPWQQEVKQGVKAGLSVVNGLHTPMRGMVGELRDHQWIWDIRKEPSGLSIGQGKARSLPCHRILTVGTDMAIGKMSTSLELRNFARQQGINTKMVATGQGGLMIVGEGLPLDAVRVDFAAGAVEQAVLNIGQDCDLLLIEGQGSLLHPGSTATLPLLRGSQPTGLILAHRAKQTHIRNCPDIPIPPLPDVIQLYEQVARGVGAFQPAKVQGIALNTAHLGENEARTAIEQVRRDTGLPCGDVVRFGAISLFQDILSTIRLERDI